MLWILAVFSYGSLAAAWVQISHGPWAGISQLALLFAVILGLPCLVGVAGNIWSKSSAYSGRSLELLVGFGFPLAVLGSAAAVFIS